MEGGVDMRYRGIIFDLDGVICSTDELHYLAWKEIADRCQIPFDREMNDQLRGVSRMESLERILSRGRGENGWACPAGSTQWRMGPRSNGPSRTPRSFCWRRKSSGCLRRTAWLWRTHRQAYRRHRRAAWTRPVSARRQSRP